MDFKMPDPKVRADANPLLTPYPTQDFTIKDANTSPIEMQKPVNISIPMPSTLRKDRNKVAWFVSNCGARNLRLEYAQQLSKYIQVDIFGA
jgi:hypothetical protein